MWKRQKKFLKEFRNVFIVVTLTNLCTHTHKSTALANKTIRISDNTLICLIGQLKKSETIAIILPFNFVFRCFLYSIMWLSEWAIQRYTFRFWTLFFINWQMLAANTLFCFIFIFILFVERRGRQGECQTKIPSNSKRAMTQSCQKVLDFIRKYAIAKLDRWKMEEMYI